MVGCGISLPRRWQLVRLKSDDRGGAAGRAVSPLCACERRYLRTLKGGFQNDGREMRAAESGRDRVVRRWGLGVVFLERQDRLPAALGPRCGPWLHRSL